MKMLNDWRYLSDDTEFAWRGYQTAWQAQEQRVKGLVEACAILVERCKKVPLRGFKEQRYFLEALQDAEEELAQYHAGQKEGGDACI